MCGISALFSRESRYLHELVARMNETVIHRGPDSNGIITLQRINQSDLNLSIAENGCGSVALGHTRLAIVDLSANGHQPMSSLDERYWITFNGEIYNQQELREEHEIQGFRFKSFTDTEVILASYARWGADCLQRFNGMFAFILVDRHTGQIFFARDRFGVKPLYYWHNEDGLLAFASEIKQFTTLPGWRARLHDQRAYDFLNWGIFDHTNDTLFSDVRQIRGGEYGLMSIDSNYSEIIVDRWYQPAIKTFDGTIKEAATKLAEILEDSIRIRLRADVPVGSCLSGGLDSSSIVCIANKILGCQVGSGLRQHTFSARSSIPRYDEGKFIESVIRATNVISHQTTPSLEQLFDSLPSLVWHQDEPFGSTSIYAQWHVFKIASEAGVKVMLDGQGADELLAGYHGYFGSFLLGLIKTGEIQSFIKESRAIKLLHGYSLWHLFKLVINETISGNIRQNLRAYNGYSSVGSSDWMNLESLNIQERDPSEINSDTPISLRSKGMKHLLETHLPMLLHYEDRNSMAFSVEARVPFLDYRVVEFAMSLNDNLKIHNGMTKAILRESMDGILPEDVRTRVDKLGFVTPEEIWLRQKAPDQFRIAMRRAIEQSHGVLNDKSMSQLEAVIKGEHSFTFLPWRIIAFGAWMDRFSVSVR